MPYVGGTSLARILEALSEIPPVERRGRHFLDVLDRVQAGRPVPPKLDGPYRRYLERASYVQATCWITACLADALDYAHAHGLVHMDVKPSNVLIAADGSPMLLDFHLARRPIRSGERISDRIGGTPGWMAPEHRAALQAVSLGQPVAQPVDHRADLYALGLLLREALGGPRAGQDDPDGRPWRRRNPEVSVGLADIVQKCLAEWPSGRYRNAPELADDLKRHLNDLPLRAVPNRSLPERWRKWRRRPSAWVLRTAWTTSVTSVVGLIVLALMLYSQRVHELETALEDGREFCRLDRFPDAVHTLGHGLECAAMVPAVGHLTDLLRQQLRVARRGQEAAALHHLADLVRFRYGITPPGAGEANALLRDIRAIWDERHLLLEPLAGDMDTHRQQQIRSDLLELVAVWAELRIGLADPSEAHVAGEDALRIVEEARDSCGASFTIDRLRRSLAKAQGRIDSSQEPDRIPRSALDHYDLGRSFLRLGQLQAASEEFQRTLDERPQDFWPNFYQGLCAYRLRQFHDAFGAFGICIALARLPPNAISIGPWPRMPWDAATRPSETTPMPWNAIPG